MGILGTCAQYNWSVLKLIKVDVNINHQIIEFDILITRFWQPTVCFINVIWIVLYQKQVSRAVTSIYILHIPGDIITCPCHWYLLLAQHSWYIKQGESKYTVHVSLYLLSLISVSRFCVVVVLFSSPVLILMIIVLASWQSCRWIYTEKYG